MEVHKGKMVVRVTKAVSICLKAKKYKVDAAQCKAVIYVIVITSNNKLTHILFLVVTGLIFVNEHLLHIVGKILKCL